MSAGSLATRLAVLCALFAAISATGEPGARAAYVGGTVNGTDQSARISAHIALATRAEFLLAKPGQGVDEGVMIEFNEMQRALTLIRHRGGK